MSYLAFATLGTASSVATLLTMTRWGRAADRVGNLKVMFLASALIPLVPLLWLVSADLAYLGFVQAFSGFAWAGFNLCSVNYLYDATTSENRTRYLAYFNSGNGLAGGLGALLGGYLAPRMPLINGYHILGLFLISGVLRAVVSLAFLPGIREVRRVSPVPAVELFHIVMGGRPVDRKMSHRRFYYLHHHEAAIQKPSKPGPVAR
jgi:MFS family permease